MTNISVCLIVSVCIVILGGIFLIYAALDLKDTIQKEMKSNESFAKKIIHVYENMKQMITYVDSAESRIFDRAEEECEKITRQHDHNLGCLEMIYGNQIKEVKKNTQKIDDLYQKTYRLQVNQSKRNAQKAISEKYMLRRYGKRHRK